jgi:hypothetical protein
MSIEFRKQLLSRWISQGLTVDEITKQAELLADYLEETVTLQKSAAPVAAASALSADSLAGGLLSFIGDRIGRTSDTLLQGGLNIAGQVAPLAMTGAAVLPIAAGYYGGDILSKMTDPGDARRDELKKREEIAELKAQTARIRQRRRMKAHNA